jgi:hypothetical protein
MTKNILVLVSNGSVGGRGQQVARQEKAMTLLKAKGIDPEIVDGSDPEQRERRNELFEISQTRGKYPLFFILDDSKNPTTTTYLGDFDDIEYMNDCKEFNRENLLPAPAEEDASESSLMAEDLQEDEIQEDPLASFTNEKFNASVYYDIQEWEGEEEEEVTDKVEEEAERPKAALLHSHTQEALVDDDQELSSVAADENRRLKQELEEAKSALKDMQENQKQMQKMINSLQVLVASPKLCSQCRQPLIPPSPEERALLPIQKVPCSSEAVEVTTPTQPESTTLGTKATPKSMSVSIEDVAEMKKKKKSSKTKKEESSKTKKGESSKTKEESSKAQEEKAVARRGKRERLSNSYLKKIGNSGPKIQIEEFVYNEKGEVIQHKKKSEFVRTRAPVAKESKDRRSNVKDSLKSML